MAPLWHRPGLGLSGKFSLFSGGESLRSHIHDCQPYDLLSTRVVQKNNSPPTPLLTSPKQHLLRHRALCNLYAEKAYGSKETDVTQGVVKAPPHTALPYKQGNRTTREPAALLGSLAAYQRWSRGFGFARTAPKKQKSKSPGGCKSPQKKVAGFQKSKKQVVYRRKSFARTVRANFWSAPALDNGPTDVSVCEN